MERGVDLLFGELDGGIATLEGVEVLHMNKGMCNGINRMDSAGSSLCSLGHSSSLPSLSRTSTGDLSTGDCFSLICTEDALDDSQGPVEGESLAPNAQFCLQDVGCCPPLPEFSPAGASEVCVMIRQDLQKQREMALALTCGAGFQAAGSAGPVACALQHTTCIDTGRRGATGAVSEPPADGRCSVGCSCSVAAASSARSAAPLRLPPAHRSRIVGWMRQVAEALGLHLATLFAAGSLLDRFVAASEDLPPDSMLQLLAIACMSVAVKYEEVGQVAPGVWLSLAVDCEGRPIYQSQDLQRMEWVILQALQWRLHVPNTYSFLSQFLLCLPHAAPTNAAAAAPAAAVPAAGGGAPSAETAASTAAAAATAATTVVGAPAAAASQGGGNLEEAPGVAQWLPVTSRAVMLAEMSLLEDCFLGYNHSTIALACVALAERMLICELPPASSPSGAPAASAAAAALAPAFGAAPCAPSGSGCGCAPSGADCCALRSGVVAAGATVAAAAVSAAAGVWVGALAPGLESCAAALRHCHVQMLLQQQQAAAAAAAAATVTAEQQI